MGSRITNVSNGVKCAIPIMSFDARVSFPKSAFTQSIWLGTAILWPMAQGTEMIRQQLSASILSSSSLYVKSNVHAFWYGWACYNVNGCSVIFAVGCGKGLRIKKCVECTCSPFAPLRIKPRGYAHISSCIRDHFEFPNLNNQ